MIKLQDVSKYYNSNGIVTIALEHINLEFNKGDIVAITGESGSGKSTLLNIICANDGYDEGEIYFNGNETSYFDLADQDNFRNNYVGFIYQNYNIIDSYTVLQNVMFPLLLKGMSHKEAKERALELITKVGLKDRVKHKGTKLSGGEKQRVVIARALASDPEILACDEPTGNLDSQTSKEIIELIKEVAKDKLVLIVTHNYEEVKDIVTRKVTLVDGKIIEDKVIKQVSNDEAKPMTLTRQKVSLKKILYFTKNNILATPHKTLFIFMIMFVMCFSIISLFQSIYYSYLNNQPTTTDNVVMYDKNYIIVKKQDNTLVNVDDFANIEGIEYTPLNCISKLSFPSSVLDSFKYSSLLPEYLNLVGELPKEDNECLVIYPTEYNAISNSYIIGKQVSLGTYSEPEGSYKFDLDIVGVCNSKFVNKPIVYTCVDYSLAIIRMQIASLLDCSLPKYYDKPISISFLSSIDKPTLYLPAEFVEPGEFLINIGGIYQIDLEYDIAYGQYAYPVLYFPYDFDFSSITIFEVGIKADNYRQVAKSLEKLGYTAYYPYGNTKVDAELVLKLLVLTLIGLVPVIFIYIISYLIIRTIYTSKFKEFMIMRSIGIDKGSMHKILLIETFSISIISSILTFLICIIFGAIFNISLYTTMDSYIVIIFFVIMILFSLFLALRMNKRLYKKTTAIMFKEV